MKKIYKLFLSQSYCEGGVDNRPDCKGNDLRFLLPVLFLFLMVVGRGNAFAQNTWSWYGLNDTSGKVIAKKGTDNAEKMSGYAIVYNNNKCMPVKMQSATTLTFKLNTKSDVTIGIIYKDKVTYPADPPILLDGDKYYNFNNVAVGSKKDYHPCSVDDDNSTNENTSKTYEYVMPTYEHVPAGEWTIKRRGDECGVFFISVRPNSNPNPSAETEEGGHNPYWTILYEGYGLGLWQAYRTSNGMRLFLGGWKYQEDGALANRYKGTTESYVGGGRDSKGQIDEWETAERTYSLGAEDPYYYKWSHANPYYKSARTYNSYFYPSDKYTSVEYANYSYNTIDNARNEYIDGEYAGPYEFNKPVNNGKAYGNPFTVPCFGDFFKLEPTTNGTVTLYVMQNGAIEYDVREARDPAKKPDNFFYTWKGTGTNKINAEWGNNVDKGTWDANTQTYSWAENSNYDEKTSTDDLITVFETPNGSLADYTKLVLITDEYKDGHPYRICFMSADNEILAYIDYWSQSIGNQSEGKTITIQEGQIINNINNRVITLDLSKVTRIAIGGYSNQNGIAAGSIKVTDMYLETPYITAPRYQGGLTSKVCWRPVYIVDEAGTRFADGDVTADTKTPIPIGRGDKQAYVYDFDNHLAVLCKKDGNGNYVSGNDYVTDTDGKFIFDNSTEATEFGKDVALRSPLKGVARMTYSDCFEELNNTEPEHYNFYSSVIDGVKVWPEEIDTENIDNAPVGKVWGPKYTGDGWIVVAKSYVKYTFKVQAGKSYYVFSNDTKLGFCGYEFENDDAPSTEIELNEDEINNLQPGAYKSVTLNRTFQPGWNAICLPFSVTESKMRMLFGTDTDKDGIKEETYELVTYNGTAIADNGKLTAHFFHHVYQDIIAGYPYMIYIPNEADAIKNNGKLKFENVTIEPNAAPLRPFKSSHDYTPGGVLSLYDVATREDYIYEGFYNPTDITAGSYYVTAGGYETSDGETFNGGLQLYTGSGNKMKGFRAFLKPNAAGEAKDMMRISGTNFTNILDEMGADWNDATVINDLMEEMGFFNEKQNVYSITGQMVRQNTTSLVGLPKGIYIVNGKKYLVK